MRFVIDACIRHKSRLVFFDNIYMYDINSIPHMTETSPMNPLSRKGEVRMKLVQMIMDNVKSGRLMALIARSADFYGPGNGKNILLNTMVFERLKKRQTPLWFLNSGKKHSFTFTDDAAKATALLGNTGDAYNQVWHLPTDHNILTIKGIVGIFAKEMETGSKVSVVPLWLLKILGLFHPVLREFREMAYQYDRDYFFDSSKFLNRFDFKPVTYHEGIRKTVRGLMTGKEYAEDRLLNIST
jgi:nucleoside-diphosphate-sugar epimerase